MRRSTHLSSGTPPAGPLACLASRASTSSNSILRSIRPPDKLPGKGGGLDFSPAFSICGGHSPLAPRPHLLSPPSHVRRYTCRAEEAMIDSALFDRAAH